MGEAELFRDLIVELRRQSAAITRLAAGIERIAAELERQRRPAAKVSWSEPNDPNSWSQRTTSTILEAGR